MKETNAESKMNVGYYAVCFIDVLGQQENLRALDDLPDKEDNAQMETFVHALKETYGVVSGTRKLFRHYFDSFSTLRQTDLSALSPEQREQYSLMTNNPIHIASFSDCVVASTSLATDRNKAPMRGVYGLFTAASSIALLSLMAGHPVRGGIDIGIGMEIEKGEIYGACL